MATKFGWLWQLRTASYSPAIYSMCGSQFSGCSQICQQSRSSLPLCCSSDCRRVAVLPCVSLLLLVAAHLGGAHELAVAWLVVRRRRRRRGRLRYARACRSPVCPMAVSYRCLASLRHAVLSSFRPVASRRPHTPGCRSDAVPCNSKRGPSQRRGRCDSRPLSGPPPPLLATPAPR